VLSSKKNRLILLVSAVIIVALVLFALVRDNAQLISLQEGQTLIASKSVTKAIHSGEYLYMYSKQGDYKIPYNQITPEMIKTLKVDVSQGGIVIAILIILILLLGAASFLFLWWQKQGAQVPKSKVVAPAKEASSEAIVPVRSNVSFSDIGGISDVKEELEEIIDFLKKPKRYLSFGARMPRGVLLVGPPGVGKTMIAKAVAAEADVPFFYQSGASFVQIYVGMGAKRVHELFSAAKRNAPSIIFIDEIDAVGKKRDGNRNDEREGTLNQLLTEMDGFEENSGVVVVAATNNIEVMDAALLRAGRFDRRIFVDLPTPREREAILGKYLRHIPNDVKLADIAHITVGFSGAALAALVNEAALLSLRQHELHVTMEHFHAVKEKVMFGKKKVQIVTSEQKRYRARYQAAKALVATWFDLPYEKIALTSDNFNPPVGQPLLRHEITARIQMHLAGMAASDMEFGEHATNVQNDITEARELAAQMIDDYAMGTSLMPCDEEKATLLDALYDETKKLLSGKDLILEKIEAILMEYESISKALVKKTIGEVL
jgi:cell division protease FtsH